MMRRTPEEEAIFAALSGVETPEYDIEAAVRRQREAPQRARRPRRAVMAAACLAVLALAACAAAAGMSGNWARFFSNRLPGQAVTTVGVSRTAGEYTLILEDAVVDDSGALLLLALSRTDGGEIDPAAGFNTFTMWSRLLADGDDFGGSSGFQGRERSEDGRTLYLAYEARDEHMLPGESVLDRSLTFQADGVAVELWDPAEYSDGRELKVSLAPLARAAVSQVEGQWDKEPEGREAMAERIAGQNVSLPLPLDERFPQYRIRGAVMTDRGLAVAISDGRGRSGDLACDGIWAGDLVDVRDGRRYSFAEGSGVELPDGTHVMLDTFANCPLGLEDLTYLELELTYEMDRVLSDEGFELPFTADSGSSRMIPLDADAVVGGETYHLDELRVSAVRVTVGVTDTGGRYEPLREDPPVLTMRDGSTLTLDYYGGGARFDREAWTYDGTFSASYTAKSEDGERVFLDVSQIEAVTFGSLTVPVP